MKIKYLTLLLLFAVTIKANAQTKWQTTVLDSGVFVKFPSAPEKTTRLGSPTSVYKRTDSVIFTAAVIDFKISANIDSARLAAIKDKQTFADQVKMGIAAHYINYKFGDIAVGKWKTYTMYQLAGEKNNGSNLLLKMFFTGSKMYTLSCLVPDKLNTVDRDIFLNSLEIIKPY